MLNVLFAVHAEIADRLYSDSLSKKPFLNHIIGNIRMRLQSEMQSGAILYDAAFAIWKSLTYSQEDLIAQACIMPPHAVDMSLKESAPDECRQRILLEHWNGTGIKRKLRSEPARKIHRQ